MSKFFYVVIFCALLFPAAGGQQHRVAYGPVLSAYLTGLAEELNELEYQLTHHEISSPDYNRAKQRLLLLRRFVENYAARSSQDIVPEFQILTAAELGALGLEHSLKSDELTVGAELDGLWKLLSIEQGSLNGKRSDGERFFVFKRLPQKEASINDEGRDESGRDKTTSDLAVIETIVVHESSPPKQNPALSPSPSPAPSNEAVRLRPRQSASAQATSSPLDTSSDPAQQNSKFQPPRILHLYLPEYTDKARHKQIEGDLIVQAGLQHDGKIKNIKVEKGLGFGLDQRAVEAVKRTGFLPAQLDGKDADAKIEITFSFKLAKVSARFRALDSSAVASGVAR